jgi:hypothetical protein
VCGYSSPEDDATLPRKMLGVFMLSPGRGTPPLSWRVDVVGFRREDRFAFV